MDKLPEVLILCGSSRPESVTHRALEVAAEGVMEAGGVPLWGDPWVNRLGLFGTEGANDAVAREFVAAAARAEGFLWGSPEYHGTCSGLLKNALDHLSVEDTEDKWAAFLATAGGRQGAQGTLVTLRAVARALHLWVPPQDVSIPSAHRALDAEGHFLDGEVANRLKSLGSNLVRAMRACPKSSNR
jgi:NAD(P)H-dependent FMN reductase